MILKCIHTLVVRGHFYIRLLCYPSKWDFVCCKASAAWRVWESLNSGTFTDFARAGPHACLGSLSWSCHHLFWERLANTSIPSLLPKDQREVCPPLDLGPFSPTAGLGAGREKDVNFGSRKSPSSYIVECSRGCPSESQVLDLSWERPMAMDWRTYGGASPSTSPSISKLRRGAGWVIWGRAHFTPGFGSHLHNEGLLWQQGGREGSLLSPPFPVLPPRFSWPACLGL